MPCGRAIASLRRRLRADGSSISRLGEVRRADRGSLLVEVAVASSILMIAVIGVIGSMGAGLTLVGEGKQRSTATAVAQERLERAHNLAYNRIALCVNGAVAGCVAPVHSTDATNPDNSVTTDNGSYQVDSSTPEPIFVDATNGALKHIDDPIQVGTTIFSVYQYVTWHDDPQITSTACPTSASTYCDYKRIVVVVTWKFPVHQGTTHRVIASPYIGAGGVVVPAVTPAPTPTPTPAPTPTPTPVPTTPPPACGAMQILSGTGALQGFTNSTSLHVQLTGTCSSIALSNDNNNYTTVSTGPFPTTVTWSIPAGDGSKTIYAKFIAGASNTTTSSSIVLDQTIPTTPGSLRTSTCGIQGNSRSTTLTWNASTDTNLVGYRLYRQTNSGAFTQVTTTTGLFASDTTSKGDNITYHVTAYDAAGNESSASNNVSYIKNGTGGGNC